MVLGFIFALIIGLSLGIMGGGGSILTVPVFVYVLEMEAKTAIALSLAVVGTASLVGSFGHLRRGNVDIKMALIFGSVAMVGTFLGAKLSIYLTAVVQLLLFAVVMLIAAAFMFKEKKQNLEVDKSSSNLDLLWIVLEGLGVGILTGIVGVGGGFMIVPALVLLGNVTMKKAVGTSLLVIAMKSFSGFYGYMGIVEIPWNFLLSFTFVTILGILVGPFLIDFISDKVLKKSFALFLVLMSFFIIYQNRDVLL